jgi:hypothetical protein
VSPSLQRARAAPSTPGLSCSSGPSSLAHVRDQVAGDTHVLLISRSRGRSVDPACRPEEIGGALHELTENEKEAPREHGLARASSDRQRRAAQCRTACALSAVRNSPVPRAFGGRTRSAAAVAPRIRSGSTHPRTPGVTCVQFDPMDAGQLVSGSDDNTVKLWSVADGKCERTFTGHSGAVLCVEWLAACQRRRIWRRQDQVVVDRRMPQHPGRPQRCCQDGRLFFRRQGSRERRG